MAIPVIVVVLVVAVLGFAVYAFNKYIDMDPWFKKLIMLIAIAGTGMWVLKVIGLWAYLMTITF